MAQFYFLSILFNIIAGLILAYGETFIKKSTALKVAGNPDEEHLEQEDDFDSEFGDDEPEAKSEENSKAPGWTKPLFSFDNEVFRLILGILSVLVGVMKLLSVFRGDIPVIGDLLPCLAGLAGGFSLLLEYYQSTGSREINLPAIIDTIFIKRRNILGYVCIVAGVLHFIFPQVVIL